MPLYSGEKWERSLHILGPLTEKVRVLRIRYFIQQWADCRPALGSTQPSIQ
jgi:hypothetical protein